MSKLIVEGGYRLFGDIHVQGSKNSALPILAATFLCSTKCVIHNCPRLSDIDAAINILEYLGCIVIRDGNDVEIDASSAYGSEIPDKLMREMRSSIVFLGAIVSKCGAAKISYPGGCELGPRPIDMHLLALGQLGLSIDECHGYLDCKVNGQLRGTEINLAFPSVGTTENIMVAAATAVGTTIIHNAAREPEITDLADFLKCCGAKIIGAGESSIIIEGVKRLHGAEFNVIPDRIVVATYMAAAAITGSEVTLKNILPIHIKPIFPVFNEAGCKLDIKNTELHITSPKRLYRIKQVRTLAYPGFPTDALAPVMAMASVADGTSIFIETIFQNRFKHVDELLRMGAKIKVEGRVSVIEGVPMLFGADVEATDLRGGAALVIAAMAASGSTTINNIFHIDRGYENFEQTLSEIGARIKRV